LEEAVSKTRIQIEKHQDEEGFETIKHQEHYPQAQPQGKKIKKIKRKRSRDHNKSNSISIENQAFLKPMNQGSKALEANGELKY
jgi:hypothetical protein